MEQIRKVLDAHDYSTWQEGGPWQSGRQQGRGRTVVTRVSKGSSLGLGREPWSPAPLSQILQRLSCCPDQKGHLPAVLRSVKNRFHTDGNRKELAGLAGGLADVQDMGAPRLRLPAQRARSRQLAPGPAPALLLGPWGLQCHGSCSFLFPGWPCFTPRKLMFPPLPPAAQGSPLGLRSQSISHPGLTEHSLHHLCWTQNKDQVRALSFPGPPLGQTGARKEQQPPRPYALAPNK